MQYTTVLLLALGVAGAGAIQWAATNPGPDGKTCLVFAADTINVKLNLLNDDNVTEPISFAITNTTEVIGNCTDKYTDGSPANSIEVRFFPDGKMPEKATDGKPWSFKLWFTAPTEGAAFKLADYTLTTTDTSAYNATTPQTFTKSSTADVDVHATGTNGYKCSTVGLALSSDSTIDVKGTRAIAFAVLEKAEFPEQQVYEQCQLDQRTSDIVPIVVGACLAGLVAVVLVAYLVGRARAKRQGYASV